LTGVRTHVLAIVSPALYRWAAPLTLATVAIGFVRRYHCMVVNISNSHQMKKIEQASKDTKEHNMLKQHKGVWNKEFSHLNSARKRLSAEIDIFLNKGKCLKLSNILDC